MKTFSRDLRLFGIDLGKGTHSISAAVRRLLDVPPLVWLSTQAPVLVYGADGVVRAWHDGALSGVRPGSTAPGVSEAVAVEIPPDVVLFHRLQVPELAPEQLSAALALEAQSVSPFPDGSAVWGWRAMASGEALQDVVVAVASRLHVTSLVEQAAASLQLDPSKCEAWVVRDDSGASLPMPVVLQGFAEPARLARDARSRRRTYAGLGIGILFLFAAACTPTIHMVLRERKATHALEALQERTRKAVALRDELGAWADRRTELAAAIGASAAPLRVIALLTEAVPDDSYVETLQIEGAKVGVTGATTNAAALMSRIGSAPGVRDVRASQPAVRQPGAEKESFGVEFLLGETPSQPQSVTGAGTAAGAVGAVAPPAGAAPPSATPVTTPSSGGSTPATATPAVPAPAPRPATQQPLAVPPPVTSAPPAPQPPPAPIPAPAPIPSPSPEGGAPKAASPPVAAIGGSRPSPAPAPLVNAP